MTNPNVEDAFASLRKKALSSHDRKALWEAIDAQMSVIPEPTRRNRYRPLNTRRFIASSSAAALFAVVATGVVYKVLHSQETIVPVKVSSQSISGYPDKTGKQEPAPSSIQYDDSIKKWEGFSIAPHQTPYNQFTGRAVVQPWHLTDSSAMPLNPRFLELLQVPQTETQSLAMSRARAGFSIHEPSSVSGWTRTFSEGVEFPIRNVSNGKFVGYTHTQTYYYDIYKNAVGQQVAVTQTMDPTMTQEVKLLQEKNPPYWVIASNLTIRYHAGSHIIKGTSGDLAILFTDTMDSMSEITVYRRDRNGTVLVLTIDGTAPPMELLSFAKVYLSAPT